MSNIKKSHIIAAVLLGLFGGLVMGAPVGAIIFFIVLAMPFGNTTNGKRQQVAQETQKEAIL